jgi:hypothetical protein
MKNHHSTFVILASSLFAACAPAPVTGNPDGSTPRADASTPREASAPPVPDNDEGAAADEPLGGGDSGGGTDDVGRCRLARPETMASSMLPATSCVDYDMGYMDGAAQAHCAGSMGTWVDNERCPTTGAYVASCRFEESGQVRVVRMYQATRGEALTPSQVQTWCMGAGGMYDGPTVPTNTGRCRVNPSMLIEGQSSVRHCVNYDQGYTESAAMTDCGAAFEPFEQCATSALVAGCRYMAEGRTKTVWFYIASRSSQLTETDVETHCTNTSGTFILRP